MPRDEIEGRGGKAFAATQLKKKDRIVPIARGDGVSMLRLDAICGRSAAAAGAIHCLRTTNRVALGWFDVLLLRPRTETGSRIHLET
jgi:hypothetical protein